ncbi:MAG: hypothetical protein Kow0056_04090 [Coriobacteriia bacterium]
MYAVVRSGGKQYRVEEGAELVVEKLAADVGSAVEFDVLFFSDGKRVVADPAALADAKVTAEVVEQFKGDKVVVFKFKRRKGYKRTKGHRQELTRVRVTGLKGPKGAKASAEAKKAKSAPKPQTDEKGAAEEAKPEKTSAEGAVAVAEAQPGMCQATTASGEPCKNKAKEGSKYCGVHAKKYEGQ